MMIDRKAIEDRAKTKSLNDWPLYMNVARIELEAEERVRLKNLQAVNR